MTTIIALIVMCAAYAYGIRHGVREIRRGNIRPLLSTWLMFFLGQVLNIFSFIKEVAHKNILATTIVIGDFLMVIVIVFVVAWHKGEVLFERFEKFYLGLAIAIGLFWTLSGNSFWTNLSVQVLITLGYVPTVKAMWKKRKATESPVVWGLFSLATFCWMFFVLEGWPLLPAVYGIRGILMSAGVVVFMLYLKKMEKHNIVVLKSGKLLFRGKEYSCALGRGGIKENKREGDGATPEGYFLLREVLFREDRIEKPQTTLPTSAILPNDRWDDDVNSPDYNRRVKIPSLFSHERLWRDDEVYDVIVVIGYNDDPPVVGKGSAIFLHIARKGYPPTEGCVALSLPDIREILALVTPDARICIRDSE